MGAHQLIPPPARHCRGRRVHHAPYDQHASHRGTTQLESRHGAHRTGACSPGVVDQQYAATLDGTRGADPERVRVRGEMPGPTSSGHERKQLGALQYAAASQQELQGVPEFLPVRPAPVQPLPDQPVPGRALSRRAGHDAERLPATSCLEQAISVPDEVRTYQCDQLGLEVPAAVRGMGILVAAQHRMELVTWPVERHRYDGRPRERPAERIRHVPAAPALSRPSRQRTTTSRARVCHEVSRHHQAAPISAVAPELPVPCLHQDTRSGPAPSSNSDAMTAGYRSAVTRHHIAACLPACLPVGLAAGL